ncbi:hypothetical protein EVAR_88217_1 [Eumeta japonica]|uniref:Uncharacterized protein n=1 Tax=Eumeta variegata TaxID=151549 RepID=A0A4C1Z0R2_EUMVA|nr:hypothetical protein EVAR_88217_1 [Eumeta japonica]
MEDMESDSSGPDENPWPHLTEVHESQYVQFEEIVKAGSNRGKTKRRTHSDNDDSTSSSNPNRVKRRIQQGRQLSIGESFRISVTGSGVPQANVDKVYSEIDILPELPSCDLESESDPDIANLLNPNSEENDDLEFISVENILNAPDRLQCNE